MKMIEKKGMIEAILESHEDWLMSMSDKEFKEYYRKYMGLTKKELE